MGNVLIIMGSKSDLLVVKKPEEFFAEQGIGCETHVASAHRNLDQVHGLAKRFKAFRDAQHLA